MSNTNSNANVNTNVNANKKSAEIEYYTFAGAANRLGVKYQQVYNRYQTGNLEGAKQVMIAGVQTYVVPVTTIVKWETARKAGSKGKRGIKTAFTLS